MVVGEARGQFHSGAHCAWSRCRLERSPDSEGVQSWRDETLNPKP